MNETEISTDGVITRIIVQDGMFVALVDLGDGIFKSLGVFRTESDAVDALAVQIPQHLKEAERHGQRMLEPETRWFSGGKLAQRTVDLYR